MLIPAAFTAIRTSPGPTGGSGRSWTRRTSGPPWPVITTALMRVTLQRDRAADGEPVQLQDAVDRGGVDRRVRRQGHHGGLAVELSANRRGDDVDPLLAEDRADSADHSRLVAVAEDRQVLGEGQVEVLAPDPCQIGNVARPDTGPGDLDRLLAGVESYDDQLGEVLGGGVARLGQLDAPLVGHVGSVDQVHRLLRVARED